MISGYVDFLDGRIRYSQSRMDGIPVIFVHGNSLNANTFAKQFESVLFYGKEDQLVNAEYLQSLEIPSLWQHKIVMIPNAGHTPQLENPEYFNIQLLSIINFCST